MGSYASYLLETVVMLAVVCGLALVAMVLAKRVGVGRPSGPIELVGQLPLDARRGLYLVKVGARVFLVGVGEGGFARLGELPASEVPLSPASQAGDGFAELFARALSRRGAPKSTRELAGERALERPEKSEKREEPEKPAPSIQRDEQET